MSWNTQYKPYQPLPQSITLNLGQTYNTTGMVYLPRQDYDAGEIMKYEVAVSLDNETFKVVAEGTWDPTLAEKYVHWSPTAARFVRLAAITSSLERISQPREDLAASAADIEVGYR
jgi:hexosaminidase